MARRVLDGSLFKFQRAGRDEGSPASNWEIHTSHRAVTEITFNAVCEYFGHLILSFDGRTLISAYKLNPHVQRGKHQCANC